MCGLHTALFELLEKRKHLSKREQEKLAYLAEREDVTESKNLSKCLGNPSNSCTFAQKITKYRIMANVITSPAEGQILVNIEDMSMLKDIKKAISMVKGVGKITLPRRRRYSSYERSLRDLDEGRVYEYESLDDLIKEIEG